jgi:NAD(P)-dependent dehydrogenase (short-subunit alcohol dehydrogenase family)
VTARFTDQVVLVTGGGSGIGRAIARAYAREGAVVAVAGRGVEPLAQTVKLIEDDGGRATAVTADVTRAADVAELVATVVERHGGLHVAVNNAGVFWAGGALADVDEEQFAGMLTTNVLGTFLCLKHEIAHMRANGGGAIVNIGSTVGPHTVVPGTGAYGATKAAIGVLTRNAAAEYATDGVRVNAISPGPINTPMSLLPGETEAERDARLAASLPAGRVGTVEEVAATVLWLTSPEAGYVVGHEVVIDGGASL